VVLPAPTRAPDDKTDPDQVDFDRTVQWILRQDPVRWALGAIVVVWSLVFIVLGLRHHDRFGTFGFDLGIWDQGIWLLSRFETPFITLRGLDFWGHHMNPVLLLFVPFYWLGAGAQFLLVGQVLAQASGAVAIYLLARDRLADRWLAVALGGVLLLHPSYQFQTWWFFHPDSLAVAPLLFAYWAATAKRWRWYAVAAVLAVACKEEVALAVAVLGVLVAMRDDRRIGAITTALALSWFALSTRVIIPRANGIGTFYESFFGEFGNTPTEVVRSVLTNPGKAFDTATKPDRMDYYRMMFAPVAFLPLFALRVMLIGAPMLAINVLSVIGYHRQIRYQYSTLVIAALMLATVEAIAKIAASPGLRRFLVGLVVVTSFGATVAWGPSPVSTKFRSGLWELTDSPRNDVKRQAIALVPEDAPTSAAYYVVTHMAHRTRIYEFPVPWRAANWGVRGENLHDPAEVQWLVLDRSILGVEDKTLLSRLLAGEFVVRFDKEDIMVAERVAPPRPA
jgi:uncharacterized membrane protein